jgi:hypothetical protein
MTGACLDEIGVRIMQSVTTSAKSANELNLAEQPGMALKVRIGYETPGGLP